VTTNFNRTLAMVAAGTERYVLPWVFWYLAAKEVHPIRGIWSGRMRIESTVFIDVTHHLLLLLLGFFTGLLLLLGRRATVPPQRLNFILVPLATTFYYLFYYTVPFFPANWQMNLAPEGWQKPLAIAGLTCVIIGPMVALWGILHLGRSFGIYVTVRKVVLTGPYQWIRHPMYLGAIFLCLGVALANFSAAFFLLVAAHVSLLMYRAHLEENHLSEHSGEYREYMKRAGFIFPRIRQRSVTG
jgi:protein-S-isoprenylcysteine O-methyltransferase Ste14